MILLFFQRLELFVYRHLLCWHYWRPLKWYGLPNEPVLSMCVVCGYIAKRL